ncbi:hypothetical protein RUM43_001204 [Polyplax serrata]|uniref:Arginine-hydroxylase NDUFAF5, mitochondrial n=1 Tax=Polyplax serrata TaxID=468196 RepID=A0AAN8SDG5_POLSC
MNSSLKLSYHLPIRFLTGPKSAPGKSRIIQNVSNNSNIFTSASQCQVQKKQANTKTLNIFDRKTKLWQRERAALSDKVESFDYVKNEIGYRLADRVFDIKRKFNRVIDLGCSRGYVSKHISADSVEHLIMTDNSELLMSQSVCNDPNVKVEKIVCDEEHLEDVFEPESIDLVISNLALHWVNDLPGCFKQIMKLLKIDGVFLGSMFGIDTLYELRSSLQLAETERKGGVSPHVSPFTKPMDVGFLLQKSGFVMQTIDVDEVIFIYPSIFELMEDLKGMGESNASWNRSLHISRDTILAAAPIYEKLYGNKRIEEENTDINGVPATFQVVYFIGWKPDPSKPQPQPKDPTMVSLKDFYSLGDIGSEPKKIKLDE